MLDVRQCEFKSDHRLLLMFAPTVLNNHALTGQFLNNGLPQTLIFEQFDPNLALNHRWDRRYMTNQTKMTLAKPYKMLQD